MENEIKNAVNYIIRYDLIVLFEKLYNESQPEYLNHAVNWFYNQSPPTFKKKYKLSTIYDELENQLGHVLLLK